MIDIYDFYEKMTEHNVMISFKGELTSEILTSMLLSVESKLDFMEDDSHPVSSSDPMLSSPAPSTLSSSPSSFYSSSDNENLSPESIDHLIV